MSEIQLLTVPGKSALAELERLRREYASTGLYPILLGDDEDYESVRAGMEDPRRDVAAILKESLAIDPARWLKDRAVWAISTPTSPGALRARNEIGLRLSSPFDEILSGAGSNKETAKAVSSHRIPKGATKKPDPLVLGVGFSE